MGNQNSSSYDSSTEQRYDDYAPKAEKVPIQRKHSTKPEKIVGVYTDDEEQQHGKKQSQVINDETFTKFIQKAKYKIRSMTNIGHHVENRNNPAAAQDVVDSNNKKENEKDQFSHFIQNTRKKLRTVSTMRMINKSFKKGKDSDN
ncbi:hypothetical protein L195_g027989 [Trifolium pratense]|uniref:Uncharacterized protein n=2 Tax=Trifolium pratense TaxID=57577 RepID=A0ACB0LXJ7_TRIPR|nr:hypothetical protein L195_g027989 [Trifolium pratense]CAJ2673089.1 unnamed protein product [Trifolium pratense]